MLSLVHVSIGEDAPMLMSWKRLYNRTSILFHHYGLYRHCSLPNRTEIDPSVQKLWFSCVEIDREQACAMCSCPLPLGLPLLIGPWGLYSEYQPPHSYPGAPVTYNVPSVSSTFPSQTFSGRVPITEWRRLCFSEYFIPSSLILY